MNPTDTKERIIYAAFNLFFNKGYKDVSLQDISRETGITKGGFYHYYKSKEELFKEMMEICYFGYMDSLVKYLKDPAEGFKAKLERIMYFYYEEFAGKMVSEKYEAGGFYIMLIDGLRRFDVLRKRLKGIYGKIESALKDSVISEKQAGIIKSDIDPELVVFEILSVIEGSFIIWIIKGDFDIKKKMGMIFSRIIKRIY